MYYLYYNLVLCHAKVGIKHKSWYLVPEFRSMWGWRNMAKHMISIAMILIPDYINYASTCMSGCFNLNLGNCNEKKWQLSLYTSLIGQISLLSFYLSILAEYKSVTIPWLKYAVCEYSVKNCSQNLKHRKIPGSAFLAVAGHLSLLTAFMVKAEISMSNSVSNSAGWHSSQWQ